MKKQTIFYLIVTVLLFLFSIFLPKEVLLFGMILFPLWLILTFMYIAWLRKPSTSIEQIDKKSKFIRIFPLIYLCLYGLVFINGDIGKFIDKWIIGDFVVGMIMIIILFISVITLFGDFVKWLRRNKNISA